MIPTEEVMGGTYGPFFVRRSAGALPFVEAAPTATMFTDLSPLFHTKGAISERRPIPVLYRE